MHFNLSKYVRLFFLNYASLYAFSEIIDKYRIYYDRNNFRRLQENLPKYRLTQYRLLYGDSYQNLRPPDYPVSVAEIKNGKHLRYVKYFLLFYLLRCLAICFLKPATSTRTRRIYLGTEMFKADSFYLETSFLIWSTISVLYLQFTLSNSVLDYKFLALFRMSATNLQYLPPKAFGLSLEQFRKFKIVRSLALFYYNWGIMAVFPIFGPVCCSFLYIQANLYVTNPIPAIIWTLILDVWVSLAVNTIFSNLIVFLVVTNYIHIKQKNICNKMKHCLMSLKANRCNGKLSSIAWSQFLDATRAFSHLQDELKDYHRFFCSYVSFVFVFYVLIISFIIYISLFSGIALYVKIIFAAAFVAHVLLLAIIIFYCGGVVYRNVTLAFQLSSILMHFTKRPTKGVSFLTFTHQLKIHCICSNLNEISMSGFNLLNGYLITYDTYRLLIINITIYFILIL